MRLSDLHQAVRCAREIDDTSSALKQFAGDLNSAPTYYALTFLNEEERATVISIVSGACERRRREMAEELRILGVGVDS